MSGTDIQGRKLVELYHRYVGEPASKRDVYGYWIFVLGGIIGLAGVLVYQIEQALFPANFAIREIAIVLAAIGLPLALLGIIILLPVRRRGMQASFIGLLISGVGIYLFTWAYPRAWYVGQDYSAEIIAVYTVGIAILAAVAMLVPIITGEKGLLVEPELGIGRDNPPLLMGTADRDSIFAIYKTKTHDWTWRIIQREAIAESAQRAPSDTDARLAVEEIRPELGAAGMLEITSAAFRLYRTESDGWRWTLVREDGGVIATNADEYPTRDGVEESVSFLKEEGPTAGLLDIRSAAFDVYEADDRWYWRLLDEGRSVLARSPGPFRTETDATAATAGFADTIATARLLGIDRIAIELFEDELGWRWRIVTADERVLATSEAAHTSRREAEGIATRISDRLQGATVLDTSQDGFELYERNGYWTWRLRTTGDEIIATAGEEQSTGDAIHEAAVETRDGLVDASIIEYDEADYEVYPEDGAWRWRLVTIARDIVAQSTDAYDTVEDAEDAADLVRARAKAAELIEFEHAAFQQYESEGEWRWRLIDEDGTVMADSGEEYASKSDVMDAMTTLKENAPNAEVLEIETAAFELYRADGGGYGWRLIDETGQLVAAGATTHDRRAEARDAVDFVRSTAESSSIREMEHAAFQLFTDVGDSWGWRLLAPAGTTLATTDRTFPTRDDATEAIEEVKETGGAATIDQIGQVAVQLRRNGHWHWRLIDIDREPIAVGERTYDDPDVARADIESVTDHAQSAPIFELGDGIVWIERTDDGTGWHWRLVDANRDEIASTDSTFDDRDSAVDAVEMIRSRIDDADLIEFEGAMFEFYRDELGAWRWRLLDEDETVMAASAVAYDRRRDAEDTLADVRSVVPDASILEIEDAAYELHRRDDGWIWRLVDENGTTLVESVTAHETRREARDEMNEVKQYAPDGQISVTW